MTLTLESFNGPKEEKLSLGDFQGHNPLGMKIGRKAAAQISATRALLGEPDVEAYKQTRDMLLDPRTRGEFMTEQTVLRDRLFDEAQSELTNYLSDSSVPQERRLSVAEGIQQGFQSPFTKTPNLDILAEESLIAPSNGEDEDAEEFRYNFSEAIAQTNQQKRDVANAINALKLGEDQGIAGLALDYGELFAPLAEWNHIDRLLRDAQGQVGEGGTDFLALLGTQKEELYNMIEALPVEDRAEFSSAIINIVTEHENIIFPDGNDLMTAETLERMLLSGEYSNFEKWFDNVTSVLDVLAVGGMVRRGVKGAARAVTGGAPESTIYKGTIESGSEVAAREGLDGEIVEGTEIVPRDVYGRGAIEDVYDLDPNQWSEVDIPRGVPSPQELPRIARSESVRTDVNPASPSQIVKDTNPNMARNMDEAAMADDTDEAAEALYGTNRTEAAANNALPEPEIKPDVAPNKVEMNKPPVYEEPENIKRTRVTQGNTALSVDELKRTYTNLFRDMEMKTSAMVIRTLDNGSVQIGARYSPPDAAFKTPQEALDSAKYAFRNYGLSDADLNIQYRDGPKWVKVTKEQAEKLPEGTSFSVGIDYNYRLRPEDISDVDLLSTGNFLTRLLDSSGKQYFARMGQGSLVQNFLDAASTIHPQIVNAASVAIDKTFGMKKLYSDLADGFSSTYSKLPKQRRVAMSSYINEANANGIKFDVKDLAARGFSLKEIETLKAWRRANDAMWHAANEDLVRTLRGKGFKAFVHKGSDTSLIGREVSKGTIGARDFMLDPFKGTNMKPTTKFLDELYENGGTLVKLNEPVKIDGEWVDYIVSRNTVEAGYTRALYDTETVLHYRDGYYPVMYDANYFVTKKVKNSEGKEFDKVVGTAKDRVGVDEALKRLRSLDRRSDYTFRKDRRFGERSIAAMDEQGWNIAVNTGLTSQKVRGQRLEDLSAGVELWNNTNLKDPLEAMANQINTLSQRIPMRQYLDTVKKRWMLNYGKYLDLPVNPVTGKTEFPASISVLESVDPELAKGFVADARTNFNYIYSLENGFINGIDEGYKAVMHLAADFMGEARIPFLENALRSSAEVAPNQVAKTAAFKMFLALNPVRQAVVQRGQMMMLGVANPEYLAKKLLPDLYNIDLARAGLKSTPEAEAILKELEGTGILQAVDSHNFIRQDQLRLADMTFMQKASGKAMTPVNYLQKVGFDYAEQDNLLAAYLAFRDKAVRQGLDITDARVKEEVLGETRAFTLNMNRAGDMPYSQNTLGIAAQFLSFPHKALLQGVSNKSLSKMEKAKLLTYTTALFGVGATALGPAMEWVFADDQGESGDVREALEEGMLSVFLNKALTVASGENVAIDWGDLAPVEAYGVGESILGLLQMDVVEVFTESPAGSLLFGANPKIANMYSTAARYFSPHNDYEDEELNTSLRDVSTAFMSLSSGYSNFFKARYALEMRQAMSSSGTVTDEDVAFWEAIALSAGFQTQTQSGYRAVRELQFGDSEYNPDDVDQWYNGLKAQLARRNVSVREQDMQRRIYSEAWRVFGHDRPKAVEHIAGRLQRDAQDGDYTMFNGILRAIGMKKSEEVWEMINALPDGQVRERLTVLMQEGDAE